MSSALATKATKLIALAASNRLEEARTAAHIACALIRDHGLRIVDPNDAPASAPPVDESPRRVIRARYDGACSACGARWREGAQIAWAKGSGARCLACRWTP